jgi:G6PDH family F420-dependent oxidoreductase
MTEIGYWLSAEEHGPRDLVQMAARAEAVGFTSAIVSDHFHPWTRTQGQSPFVWGVLGGIAEATTSLRVGTGVTCPILRMHPAIVAHAAATAAAQLEGRFFLGVGTGERLNEHVTGRAWPASGERRAMLEEAVAVIRELLDGGNVNHVGTYFTVENAQLFTRPVTPPEIVVAASGVESAQLAGRVGDGLMAVAPDPRVVEAFEAAGGAGKPRLAQLHVCWAPTVEEARKTVAEQWPNGALEGAALTDLARPVDFEAVTDLIPEHRLVERVVCGPDPEPYVEAIARRAAAGFTHVCVQQIGSDQEGFLRFFAEDVRPHVHS